MFRYQLWFLSLAVGVATWAAIPTRAEASFPYPAGFGCWGAGWGFYSQDYIPYFSRHPPVYYSFPVRRTYGYSPWAYPPGVMTPQYRLRPATTLNPHVSRPATRSTTADEQRTAQVAPLRIRNPFVESNEAASEVADVTSARQTEPRRVFPVAMFEGAQ